MRAFRLLWLLHRWIGVGVGIVLLVTAATGFLLLKKKDWAWIQPPVTVGVPGPASTLKPLQDVYAAVFALGLPEFREEADIARIDFRPSQGVHKVTSKRGNLEVQVCATTLRTSAPRARVSDVLEQIHDGSWFGDAMHSFVSPAAALALLFLSLSGYAMWLWPKWQRHRAQAKKTTC
jgi:uncharacterized iron-regulated membrane protein